MTGPEHYRAAERLLSDASFTNATGTPVSREGHPIEPRVYATLIDRAQVHATLALAAATAIPLVRNHVLAEMKAWSDAAGTRPDAEPPTP
jgi:hypothetical protein